MSVSLKDGVLSVSRPTDNKTHRALHGLTRSLLANMVEGVNQGFKKTLELQGVGYRATKSGDKLVIQVGYIKPVELVPPPGISLAADGATVVSGAGVDKELVGMIAYQIREIKP